MKPQLEVGKKKLPSDGVVKDEADREAAFQDLRAFVKGETSWSVVREMEPPVQGEKGNIEFLVHVS